MNEDNETVDETIEHLRAEAERLRALLDKTEDEWVDMQAENKRLRERDVVTQGMWGKAEDDVKGLRAERDEAYENSRFVVEQFDKEHAEVERLRDNSAFNVAQVVSLQDEVERLLNELKLTQEELMKEQDEVERLQEVLEELAHPTMDVHELSHLSDMQQVDIGTARAAIAGQKA
jgi:predicted nuclease with TOPRIM domain